MDATGAARLMGVLAAMADYVVCLNADEIMVLSDRVSAADVGPEPHAVCAYPLLLKLGSLFVELVGSGTKAAGELPVTLTEAELWLLRGKVTTGDKTATDPLFGVKLLAKIYTGLLQLNGAGTWPLADEESPADKAQTVERLKGWAERKEPTTDG